jgi:hypothetical protein
MREIVVILAAVFLEGATHCGDIPPAPYTTRAVQSDWGPAVSGLSARLAMDSSRADLGSDVRFEILLRAEPRSKDVSARILNAVGHAQRFRLEFKDVQSGKIFVRHTSWYGPWACRFPSDRFDLYEGAVHAEGARIRLLSSQGEQVPAGHYQIHAVYENDGGRNVGVRESENGGRPYEEVQYPADSVWRGKVATGTLPIEIVHREPETIHFEIPPLRLVAGPQEPSLQWEWGKGPTIPVDVNNRPGYFLGLEGSVSYRTSPDSSWKNMSRFHQGAVGPYAFRDCLSIMAFGLTPDSTVVQDGVRIDAKVELMIIENSSPRRKGALHSKDFRILHSWEVVESWPKNKRDSGN